jgi:uncharacterized protein YajQ (UPF0234 family)
MAKKEVTNDEIMQALNQFTNEVNKRFDGVDARFERIDQRFDGVDARLDKLDDDVNRIYGILDKHMARIEEIMQENSVQTHQQERLQRWIFQLADQSGVQLKYE